METINFLEEIHFEDYAFAVTLPIPSSEAEWRAVVRDPSKFTAKKMAKGVEVSWQKLNEQQRSAMKEAKQPSRSRSMSGSILRCAKLLWGVYQLQDSCNPDLGAEDVRSPTLSRQGRQGLLQLSSHRPWQTWKADAKAAFLRGRSSQLDRQIFGMPV